MHGVTGVMYMGVMGVIDENWLQVLQGFQGFTELISSSYTLKYHIFQIASCYII